MTMKILTKSIGCGFRSKFDHQRFCLCGFQMYIKGTEIHRYRFEENPSFFFLFISKAN